MKITIIGTGYVGLTTGIALALLNHEVTCLDNDIEKIKKLTQHQIPIYEPFLKETLQLVQKNIQFTSSYKESISKSAVVFIAVGTPANEDGSPNLSFLKVAAQTIAENLGKHFTVIINKSTVPIGSGNWIESIIQESYLLKNSSCPINFSVASNPEFLREGSAFHDSLYPDRIVVGSNNPNAIEVLYQLYKPIIEQSFIAPSFLPRPESLEAVPFITTNLASAELIKYAANAFLALKISYINEIAQLSEKVGADITQIAKGIGLDTRIGTRFLQAGIGWGGSCFSKDTSALLSTSHEYGLEMPIVRAAKQVNTIQRSKVIEKLLNELKILKGKTIGIIGLAFKPHTDDLRDAPSIDIIKLLIQRGVRIKAYDPIAVDKAKKELKDTDIYYADSIEDLAKDCDSLVLVTEWPEFQKINWHNMQTIMRSPIIIDGRNFLDSQMLTKLGFKYIGFGR